MSRNYSYRTERPRRRGNGCLVTLVVLVWIVLLAVIGYRFFIQPQISEYIGSQIAEQANPPGPVSGPGGATDQVAQQAQQNLPTVVAALPSGTIRVTEQQANEFLASHQLGPLDSATVQFVPGEVQVALSAFGTTSTAYIGLAVQNGRVIAVNPRIDGLLGQVISLKDLTSSLEQNLNDQLNAQGRRISEVQVNQGEVVVTIDE